MRSATMYHQLACILSLALRYSVGKHTHKKNGNWREILPALSAAKYAYTFGRIWDYEHPGIRARYTGFEVFSISFVSISFSLSQKTLRALSLSNVRANLLTAVAVQSWIKTVFQQSMFLPLLQPLERTSFSTPFLHIYVCRTYTILRSIP